MKIQLTPIEQIVPGHKIMYEGNSNKTASNYPNNPSRFSAKKTVDPDDSIYLVMDTNVEIKNSWGTYIFKTIVLRSKHEEINSYTIKIWSGEPILTIEIDNEELALLALQQ